VSRNFDRWTRCLGEQDPAKLTVLANELNLMQTQKTLYVDPPLHAAGSHDEGQRNLLKPNAESKLCFT
jgi:hypothetical protein